MYVPIDSDLGTSWDVGPTTLGTGAASVCVNFRNGVGPRSTPSLDPADVLSICLPGSSSGSKKGGSSSSSKGGKGSGYGSGSKKGGSSSSSKGGKGGDKYGHPTGYRAYDGPYRRLERADVREEEEDARREPGLRGRRVE